MKTVNIKGKEYVEVNERVKYFRDEYPNWTIQTDIIKLDGDLVITKTSIIDEDGRVISTGLAYEKDGSSFINKTSYIENCETSSVGRALGFLGIGIDTSIASSQEVQNAILNQDKPVGQSQQRVAQQPSQSQVRVAQQPQPQPQPQVQQEPQPEKICYCGNPMEYKEGISKKGNPYKMWKCNCGNTEWIND